MRKIYQAYLDKERNEEKAEDNLVEFLGANDFAEVSINSGQTQRIILVAANFRKEVTSTVLWLLNYKLRVQCFKVTPFENNGSLLLNIEQIIPMKESEEYVISMADKTQDDINVQEELKTRHLTRMEFWRAYLDNVNRKTTIYQNVSPSKDNWISGATGILGIHLNSAISNSYARAELYFARPSRDENKFIFDELLKQRNQIEKTFGEPLIWERLENRKACRIKYQLDEVDSSDKDNWPKMIEFISDGIARLEKALKEPLKKLKLEIKNS